MLRDHGPGTGADVRSLGDCIPRHGRPDLKLVAAAMIPRPVASLGLFPFSLSTLETIQLYDFSYDPGRVGIASRTWDFGDGASSTDPNPAHAFVLDGDYTVTLTVHTSDGRSGSTTQAVRVRTHDIGIAHFGVPRCARAGETCPITVGVTSSRYEEAVQVQVERRRAAGPEQVGAETMRVPPGCLTCVSFPYTFSPEDALAGTVSFEAVATIVGARDASPDDNGAVALTVVVG